MLRHVWFLAFIGLILTFLSVTYGEKSNCDNTDASFVNWIDIDLNSFQVRVPCTNDKYVSTVIFDKDYTRIANCFLQYNDGYTVNIGDMDIQRIEKIGTVTFAKDANERILVVGEDGGSGGNNIYLTLICPRYETCIGISMWFSANVTKALPQITTTDNYNDKRLIAERQFLEKLKYEYGFLSGNDIAEKENDPRYAWYFWDRDNGKLLHGMLIIKKYAGNLEFGSTVEDVLQSKDITYTAYFKAGVVAYNSKTDEHYILFHPESMYSWPTKLAQYGNLLIIGTRGEGLVIINTSTLYMERITLSEVNQEVKSLVIKGSQLIVNDAETVDLDLLARKDI